VARQGTDDSEVDWGGQMDTATQGGNDVDRWTSSACRSEWRETSVRLDVLIVSLSNQDPRARPSGDLLICFFN
jgi:hypothetical protein